MNNHHKTLNCNEAQAVSIKLWINHAKIPDDNPASEQKQVPFTGNFT